MEQYLQQISIILENIDKTMGPKWFLNPQWYSVLILFVTLVIITIYTIYTRRIAQSAIENLRPIVSCELRSVKNNDTRCIINNWSKYNLSVSVNLNLKANGKLVKVEEVYSGKKFWPVGSYQRGLNGHFDISEIRKSKVKLGTIDLEVKYKSNDSRIWYKNPVQHWVFDKTREVWVNEIGLAV